MYAFNGYVICGSPRHFGSPVFAVDVWESPGGHKHYLCAECSVTHGASFRKFGYKWSKLPDTSQVQPTSERVQP